MAHALENVQNDGRYHVAARLGRHQCGGEHFADGIDVHEKLIGCDVSENGENR